MGYTLQDIADMVGVSKVTVHKAIYGKPGVSDKVRQEILAVVQRVGYTVNPVASSLKRDRLKIAVIIPKLEPARNYFYNLADAGVDSAIAELEKFRTSIIRYYCDDTWDNQAEILEEIIEKNTVDGVVMYCNDALKPRSYFSRLRELNIPVITFHSDAIHSCRIGSVTAPCQRTGHLAAEAMSEFVQEPGHILILGGNKSIKVLQDVVTGFFDYLYAERPDLSLLEVNDYDYVDKLMEEIKRLILALGDIKGIYCANARNGLPLCKMITECGFQNIKLITSDVYKELWPYFEQKVITATIWQNPQSQSRTAILQMYEYLTTQTLVTPEITVPIGIIMKNNFQDYCK